jgi:FkbM family methyltransferase
VKILWHSVAPWAPTGYGQQTAINAPRIKNLGHDLVISAYYGLQGAELMWNGLKVLPSYSAAYGSDVIVPHALHHFDAESARSLAEASSRGLIITLGDVFTFQSPMLDKLAIGSWTPVDHLQLPYLTQGWFEGSGAVPIAMSRFGENALREAGLNPVYVPHGIDTTVFRPGDKVEARAGERLPQDAFIVGMVANNAGRDGNRKAFAEQIMAFAELRRKHSDVMLVLHTDVDAPGGAQIRHLLRDMLPDGSYSFTDIYHYRKGLNIQAVAQVHRCFDVLSNCSYGEGFGIPIIEAQACGTPVVVTDATAMPELCGSGWKVGYEPMWHDSQGAWAAKPRVGDIVDAYLEAYDKARDEGMRADAWAFAQLYDADTIIEQYWKPVLDKFEQALTARAEDIKTMITKPPPPKIKESDGWVWLDRGSGTDDWVAFSDHESWLQPVLATLFPKGGVLLDVGAHVGRWSIRLSPVASRVIAVEANPSTAATLRRHLAMNDVHNVDVVQVAAWDENTVLHLEDPNHQLDGGGARTLPSVNGQTDMVPAVRLDSYQPILDLLADAGRLDLMKLDVEGADIHALRGMAGLLEKYKPVLVIECHDIYGYYEREDLEQTLTDLGYEFEVAASVGSNWQPGVGKIDEVRAADYLVASPAHVHAG